MKKRDLRNFDFLIMFSAAAIFAIGLMIVYSASSSISGGSQDVYVTKQLQALIVGVILAVIIFSIDYRRFADAAFILYVLDLIFLAVVLAVGAKRLGATRWINIGGIGFQPSEFAKIIFILALSSFLARRKDVIKEPSNLIWSIVILLPLFFLIVIQPDLGTALMLMPILIAIVYVSGVNLKGIGIFLASCLIASPFFWHFLKDYQKKRLLVFINPDMDPLGAGYTIIQSKIAIGSGQFLGKGWLAGTQSQLNFLPERHTDFIFSVLCEEWGFLGAFIVIALYFVIIYRGISIIEQTTDTFGKLVATGIVSLLAFQVVVNIGMTMGLLPVVGITLPFISYGGSSLITSIVSIAILLNIGVRRPLF